MNKFKLLVMTALVAATVGVGALAAAPSASALREDRQMTCKEAQTLVRMYANNYAVWQLLVATGYEMTETAKTIIGQYRSAVQHEIDAC